MTVNSLLDSVCEYSFGSLCKVWPAFGKNSPTESNIRTACTAVLSSLGYSCYSEMPFKRDEGNIRVDFVAIQDLTGVRDAKTKGTIILAEMKTDGSGDANIRDWIMDFNSIYDLPLEFDHIYIDDIESMEKICLSFFWTDNKDKQNRIKGYRNSDDDSMITGEMFGLSFNGKKVFLFDNSIGWCLKLFVLANSKQLGREEK